MRKSLLVLIVLLCLSLIPIVPIDASASPTSFPETISKGYIASYEDGSFKIYNEISYLWVFKDKDEIEYGSIPIRWSINSGGNNLSSTNIELVQIDSYSIQRTITFSDTTVLTIKYTISDSNPLKISLSLTSGKRAAYQIVMKIFNLGDLNKANTVIQYSLDEFNKVINFTLPDYLGSKSIKFDWHDVNTITILNTMSLVNNNWTFQQSYYCGIIPKGITVNYDPTTVSTSAGQYATALGNSRKLFRDSNGKYIAVWKNTNVMLGYCNSDPPTSGWDDNDLGSSYLVDSGEAFGVTAAYDSTNDKLMIAWTASSNFKAGELKLQRTLNFGSGVGDIMAMHSSSFTRLGNRRTVKGTVTSISFWLGKSGSPTGTVYSRIRLSSDDSILETSSTTYDIATQIDSSAAWKAFTFNTQLTDFTDIRICVEYNGGDSSNYLKAYKCNTIFMGGDTEYWSGWTDYPLIRAMYMQGTLSDTTNILDFTVSGSVLSITPYYVVAHSPSLWMLHNGEVAAVWGSDKASGAKHSRVEFCRLVFGSPPTYKNGAGTSSSTDLIFTDYTSSFQTRYPSIVERTNSGTGQYDLFAFCYGSVSTNYKKVKGTWSSPTWSWGSEATPTVAFSSSITTNYDTTNGLITYGQADSTSINMGSISSSDTDTDISKTGLASATRIYSTITINSGDYYIFYAKGTSPYDIYYMKRMAGTWDTSETKLTTTTNENYPSCKVDGAGSKIELIWTHYTGSAYNVYYDYISLGAQSYTRTATMSLTSALTDYRRMYNKRTSSASLTTAFAGYRTLIIPRTAILSLTSSFNNYRLEQALRTANNPITSSFTSDRKTQITRIFDNPLTTSFNNLGIKGLIRSISYSIASAFSNNLKEALIRNPDLSMTEAMNAYRNQYNTRVTDYALSTSFIPSSIKGLIRSISLSLTSSLNPSRIETVVRNPIMDIDTAIDSYRLQYNLRVAPFSLSTSFLVDRIRNLMRSISVSLSSAFDVFYEIGKAGQNYIREVSMSLTSLFDSVRLSVIKRTTDLPLGISAQSYRLAVTKRSITLAVTSAFDVYRLIIKERIVSLSLALSALNCRQVNYLAIIINPFAFNFQVWQPPVTPPITPMDTNLTLFFIFVPLLVGFFFIRRAPLISCFCSMILIIFAAILASNPYITTKYYFVSNAWYTNYNLIPLHPLTEIFIALIGVIMFIVAVGQWRS